MLTDFPPYQPHVNLGIHPDYGIIATTPTRLPAASWMLERLDFHPVPDHPTMFALNDQAHDGHTRTEQAIATLRMVGYEVNADAFLYPGEVGAPFYEMVPDRTALLPPVVAPDVAFAEHPWLGVIAATADTPNAVEHGKPILEANGWRHDAEADIYVLPTEVDRRTSLDRVAQAVTTMHRSDDLHVALQPALAEGVASRTASTTHGFRPVDQFPTRKFTVGDAARATSPALASRPPAAAVPQNSATAVSPAEQVEGYSWEIQAVQRDLANRDAPHPGRIHPTPPSVRTSTSSEGRVAAALATSPAATRVLTSHPIEAAPAPAAGRVSPATPRR
ncbi:hypothetical protein E6W39_06615 [Kitasatospora acidiphila]|uniref:Uncharacterized protein n=1 Tax=Kitasatospora acidiphila TaxID=2567942 RepID=A0A540VZ33_9ACTN|nr:hypothetical protein [Kitasatospora acidiphila]TQF02010.1 hypothetical protein E6W39_06615 [Kitasatospora acidiphila]